MPFNQCMLFPCELSLRTTDEGIRMFAVPVKELAGIRGQKHEFAAQSLKPGDNPLGKLRGQLWEIQVEFDVPAADSQPAPQFGLSVRGTSIAYDPAKQTLSAGGKTAPLTPSGGKIRLQVLVDRTTVEIFANDGRVYMPLHAVPKDKDDDPPLAVFAKDGPVHVGRLEVCELKSVWP